MRPHLAILVLLYCILASASAAQIKSPQFPDLAEKDVNFVPIAGFKKTIAMADEGKKVLLGGVQESSEAGRNSVETEDLARFAVEQHNQKENALLEFVRVVRAKEQVVAGTLHHLSLEAIDAGKKKLYEAKVWVKPWLGFKELQEFRHTADDDAVPAAAAASSLTSSDLGALKGGHEPGWRDVPVQDPVVTDAAGHAVKTLQQRSNSLFPYELLEVVRAKAEVIENFVKLNILLKLKRGNKEEKYNAEVHRNLEGAFVVNQVHQEHEEAA